MTRMTSLFVVILGIFVTAHLVTAHQNQQLRDKRGVHGLGGRCTSVYERFNGVSCQRARLGDVCEDSNGLVPIDHDFCQAGIPYSTCSTDGYCVCSHGYQQVTSPYGEVYCQSIREGSTCVEDSTCQITMGMDARCHHQHRQCHCLPGTHSKMVIDSAEPCAPIIRQHVHCLSCQETGGICLGTDGGVPMPVSCACPWRKLAPYGLESGCTVQYAYLGEVCTPDGQISCLSKNTECKLTHLLNNQHRCQCKTGFVAIRNSFLVGPDRDVTPSSVYPVCQRRLSSLTDPDCENCIENNGVCFDANDDYVMDGCECPKSRSTTDPGSGVYCDQQHVKVSCNAEVMKVCYSPREGSEGRHVTIEGHDDLPYCRFVTQSDLQLCVELDAMSSTDTESMTDCGVHITKRDDYLKYSTTVLVQERRTARSVTDYAVHVFCTYDILVHVYSGNIQVTGESPLRPRYEEGRHFTPDLTMRIVDSTGNEVGSEGRQLGDLVRMEVTLNLNDETRDIFYGLRPEVCILSNMANLRDPDVESEIILYRGCPVDPMYGSALFQALPGGVEVLSGQFPFRAFVDSHYSYYHCAVMVCRDTISCVPEPCPSVSRGKRSISVSGPHSLPTSLLQLGSHYQLVRLKRQILDDPDVEDLYQSPDLDKTGAKVTVRLSENQRLNDLHLIQRRPIDELSTGKVQHSDERLHRHHDLPSHFLHQSPHESWPKPRPLDIQETHQDSAQSTNLLLILLIVSVTTLLTVGVASISYCIITVWKRRHAPDAADSMNDKS